MTNNILLVENHGADFYKSRLKYATYLIQNGWNVFVLVPDDEYTDQIRKSGLIVYTYVRDHRENWLKQVLRIRKAYHRIFTENHIDIVHSYRLFPNFINVLVNIFSRRKVVLHITGLGIVYSNSSLKYLVYRQISNLIYFFMISFSDITIVQNPNDRNDLLFFPFMRKKLVLIKGSGVDTKLFSFDPYFRESIRIEYNIDSTELLFMCVTRLIWEKGIREMVSAFQEICKSQPHVKLIIVGSPHTNNPRYVTAEYIESMKGSNNIIFAGSHDNIPQLLCAADVFIYPSYYREGVPRSILEALSIGLPIITTNTPGCNLTVMEGCNGYLIESRSAKAIYDTIHKFLEEPAQLKNMGLKSRTIVEENFRDIVIYEQLRQVY